MNHENKTTSERVKMSEQTQMRTVKVKGAVYIRKEDVIELLMDIGATEVTDVRWRLERMAQNIDRDIR